MDHGRIFALDTSFWVSTGVSLINILLLILAAAGFVLFVKVLIKLNKALDIWLEKNRSDK